MKRTTVYLKESELETLKQLCFIQNTSMADLIRKGIQELCNSVSADEKAALMALAKIRHGVEKSGLSDKVLEQEAIKAQRDLRRGKKSSRHRH